MLNWHYYIWVLVNYETSGKLANVSLKECLQNRNGSKQKHLSSFQLFKDRYCQTSMLSHQVYLL